MAQSKRFFTSEADSSTAHEVMLQTLLIFCKYLAFQTISNSLCAFINNWKTCDIYREVDGLKSFQDCLKTQIFPFWREPLWSGVKLCYLYVNLENDPACWGPFFGRRGPDKGEDRRSLFAYCDINFSGYYLNRYIRHQQCNKILIRITSKFHIQIFGSSGTSWLI